MYDNVDEMFYGQATDDGNYDDVDMYGPDGQPSHPTQNAPASMMMAWGIIVLSLAALWVLGAGVFKGSNQS